MSEINSKFPFDLNSLRLSQDFESIMGVKKLLVTVPVRKPSPQAWIRVNGDPGMCFETPVLELKEERETYLVDRSLWNLLAAELVPKAIFEAIDRAGNVFIWPIRLPGPDGRLDAWNQSALEAAHAAQKNWMRMTSDMALGAYRIRCTEADWPDPIWPDKTLQELLEIAFKDRFITTMDHPVILKLQGKE